MQIYCYLFLSRSRNQSLSLIVFQWLWSSITPKTRDSHTHTYTDAHTQQTHLHSFRYQASQYDHDAGVRSHFYTQWWGCGDVLWTHKTWFKSAQEGYPHLYREFHCEDGSRHLLEMGGKETRKQQWRGWTRYKYQLQKPVQAIQVHGRFHLVVKLRNLDRADEKKIQALEKKYFWRLHIYKEQKSNGFVRSLVTVLIRPQEPLPATVRLRKLVRFGHVPRHDTALAHCTAHDMSSTDEAIRTGGWITARNASSATYWKGHRRSITGIKGQRERWKGEGWRGWPAH